MTDPPALPSAAPPKRYKIVGPERWARGRELYLAGLPARDVAELIGVTVHALRKRATQEGWTRRAHAATVLDLELPKVGGDRRSLPLRGETQAPYTPPEPEPLGEADPAEAAAALARRAAAAGLAGRVEEAQALLKTAEALRKAAAATTPDAEAAEDWEPYTDADYERAAANLNRNLRLGEPDPA